MRVRLSEGMCVGARFPVEGIKSLGDGVTGGCELPDVEAGDLVLAPGVERQNQPLMTGICTGDSQGLPSLWCL